MQQDPSMAQAPQPQQAQAATAQVHYFDVSNHKEVRQVLIDYTGFIYAEVQKEPLTYDKLGNMLTIFLANCVRIGMSPQEQPVAEGTCTHVYTRSKGENNGKVCGKPAKFIGVDGQKKCSSHKASKPAKTPGGAPVASGAAGQVFSYSANATKGKVAPQALSTIQAAIAKQTEPAALNLVQEPPGPDGRAGRVINQATGMVFEQRDGVNWVVVGAADGPNTVKLTVNDLAVCYGNSWTWWKDSIDDEAAKALGHPMVIGGDHPLVSPPENTSLVMNKLNSIMNNNQ
jgi:hypothetical protein